jgi:hypothetical protein
VEIVVHRARIGHTYLTHSHLKGEDAPTCIPCDCPLTVEHILTNCIDFSPTRDEYYKVNHMYELLHTVNCRNILDFLKEIELFKRF